MDSIPMAKQKKIKPHQRINKQTDSNGMEGVHPSTHYLSSGYSDRLFEYLFAAIAVTAAIADLAVKI